MGGGAAVQQVFTHTQRVRLLYKTILKLHRGFPVELKALGKSLNLKVQNRILDCISQVFLKQV